MSDFDTVICRCNSDQCGDTLWSLCSDDIFCSKCGVRVTHLVSEQRFPDNKSGEIWVYPKTVKDRNNVFIFTMFVAAPTAGRGIIRRVPNIDVNRSQFPVSQHFSRQPKVPVEGGGNRFELVPKEGSSPELSLPPEGEHLKYSLVGDFGEIEVVVRACRKPRIIIEFTGIGIDYKSDWPAQPSPEPVVIPVSQSRLSFMMLLRALDGPALISSRISDGDFFWNTQHSTPGNDPKATVMFRMPEAIDAGQTITVTPIRREMTVDASDLAQTDQLVEMNFKLFLLGLTRIDCDFILQRIEKGGLEFDPRSGVVFPQVFVGERICSSSMIGSQISGQVFVRNCGRDPVFLSSPRLEMQSEVSGKNWFNASWNSESEQNASPADKDRLIQLNPKEQRELFVQIDLTSFTEHNLAEMTSLSGRLLLTDSNTKDIFRLPVTVSAVRHRVPNENTLCIDFGNTASFASIANPENGAEADWIIPVHDLQMPDSFPTAIFFEEVTDDPQHAKYLIGREAILEGRKLAAKGEYRAVVTELKKWIGESDRRIAVFDARGEFRNYSVADMVVLFLKRLVENAEALLRKYVVQKICLSHPAKFVHYQRADLNRIVDRVCQEVSDSRTRPLQRVDQSVDEASAVAVGSVFSETVIKDFLQRNISSERPYFVVAAFDFGGGSLDTALIRFDVEHGDVSHPKYNTTYLGIGGHAGFGGDNVTLAVFELLCHRIAVALAKQNLNASKILQRIAEPSDRYTSESSKRKNFEILWQIAERIKIAQCDTAQSPDQKKIDGLREAVRLTLLSDFLVADDPAEYRTAFETFVRDEQFLVPLDDIYGHSFEKRLAGQARLKYTIRKYVEYAFEEVVEQAERAGLEIDIFVISGASSQLPLISKTLNEKIPHAIPIPAHIKSKSRVANGLVRFLDAEGFHEFANSGDFTNSEYCIKVHGADEFHCVIPSCTPVRQGKTAFEVCVDGKPVPLSRLIGRRRILHIYRRGLDRAAELHGSFDLAKEPDRSTSPVTLPLNFGDVRQASLALEASEDALSLNVQFVNGLHCTWTLTTTTKESY